MKNKVYLLAMMLLCAFTACDDDDDDKKGEITGYDTEKLTQEFESEVSEGTFTFKTNGAWTSQVLNVAPQGGNADWVTVSPKADSKAGEHTIRFTLSENDSESDRKASVKINCGDASVTVNITQNGLKPLETYENPGEFMYVAEINGKKYAAFKYGYLADEKVNDYHVGECIQGSIKVTFKDNEVDGFAYKPDEFVINSSMVFPVAMQFPVAESTAYPAEDVTIADAFHSISIRSFVPDNHLGDRWLFQYTVQLTDEEIESGSTAMEIYFNPDKQYNLTAQPLPEGTAVLDIVLKRMGEAGEGEAKMTTRYQVIDFSGMRDKFETLAAVQTDGSKRLKFYLRYLVLDNAAEEGYKLLYQDAVFYSMGWDK